MPKIDEVMSANPEYLYISTSGFTQPVYGITHRGGDIDRVKKNMIELAESKKRTNSRTRIKVKYLLYLGNVDEAIQMKNFTESLGFSFETHYAQLMPLEKLLDYVSNGSQGAEITEEDRQLLDLIVYPHREIVDLTEPYKKLPCLLLEDWIMINAHGDVQLCCMTYDESKYTITNFLSAPISEIQARKREHWQCRDCTEFGIAAARNWPVLEIKKHIMMKFTDHYGDVILDFRNILKKIPKRGRFHKWMLDQYFVSRSRITRIPWLRKVYFQLHKKRPRTQ
jgi:hypothetical protein